ncbi:MAG TPA: flagellar hook-associated protein FlgK [Burkholderiaceae bacterium]|jgi:flagellar hook-associated protein 1 FlgK
MTSILTIGQTGLNAAQLGLATTGHNIANAATPGYSRQLVVQSTPIAQNVGVAFAGNGTTVSEIKRAYNDFLAAQVNTAQTSQGQLGTYYTQMQQINNMFADTTSGLSPTLQNFFSTIQNVAADPTSTSSRQTMLAAANTLASKFQSMDGQLSDIRQGVNEQITTTIGSINTYATQIANLNQAISDAQLGNNLKPANDLLDQRDQVLSDLSKQVQVSVVKQGDAYNIFIGNGQPLVINNQSFSLVAAPSTTDLSRLEVGYVQNGTTIPLGENNISGGTLGGLFDFRSQSLDPAQNAVGRIAIGLADTFNAQHELGQDQNGALGGAFFNVGAPTVTPSTINTGTGVFSAVVSNVAGLTTSDYSVKYDGTNYIVTQLSDNTIISSTTLAAAQIATAAKGFNLSLSGSPAAGDTYLIKPTAAGATGFNVAITDTSKIAVAAPIRTATVATNSGSGLISPGAVTGPISISTGANAGSTGQITGVAADASYTAATLTPAVTLTYHTGAPNNLTGFPATMPVTVTSGGVTTTFAAGSPVTYTAGATVSFGGVSFVLSGTPVNNDTYTLSRFASTPASTLTYTSATNMLSGFPATAPVTVTSNGVTQVYQAGATVPYTAGATISYSGISFTLSGTPANNDQFTVGPNPNGTGDNRNALLLGALQTANTMVNGTSSYQSAYGQMVNTVGNKTRELEVTSTAASALVTSAIQSEQAVSGVNLDEEATNLMKYQQAYQASGKVMQTASKMFDVLLTLGS